MKTNKLTKIIIALCLIGFILTPLTTKVHSTNKIKYSKVVVCGGDTLWSIASEYINKNDDIRELVYNIKKTNNLTSAIIVPGQELLIPN